MCHVIHGHINVLSSKDKVKYEKAMKQSCVWNLYCCMVLLEFVEMSKKYFTEAHASGYTEVEGLFKSTSS